MNTKKLVRVIWYGFIIWLVPFVVAFAFIDRSGKLTIDEGLFKSLMVVISAIVAGASIVRFFKQPSDRPLADAWLAGLTWLGMNWMLDILVLLPISGMDFRQYVFTIGIRYLQIPILPVVVAMVIKHKQNMINQ